MRLLRRSVRGSASGPGGRGLDGGPVPCDEGREPNRERNDNYRYGLRHEGRGGVEQWRCWCCNAHGIPRSRMVITASIVTLSRDSQLSQRIDHSLPIEVFDGRMDRGVERGDVGEGLMGELMRLEVVPDDLNVIQFRRIFG